MRIASLLPSATEIVRALGVQGELVGRSHECDYPPDVREVPALTRTRLGTSSSSVAIHDDVRSLAEQALALYEVDLDALALARPDVIVTQDLCGVCAVSLGDVCRATERVLGHGVSIVSLRPERLSDVWNDVRRVGHAVGRTEAGEACARELEERVRSIAGRARGAASRPSVLSVEWLSPVMIGGLWMPELIELSGGTPLVTRPGEHAPTLGASELARLEPDIVLIKPCGFDLERALAERTLASESLPWGRWRAVREGRVFVTDGNAFFNRSGPRLVESLEILAACVDPREFGDFCEKHGAKVRRLTATLRAVAL